MKAEYRRDLQHNYLILLSEDAEEDSYELRMAQQNEIAGLLAFHSARKDGELQFYYEITSKQPVSSLYEKRLMNCSDILILLGGIRDVMEHLQKYLLNPAQLLFLPDYIYMDAERRNVFLCYFPDEQQEMSILDLAEFILKRLDHEDRSAVELGYSFYQKASEENFSLYRTLKELLLEARSADGGEYDFDSAKEREQGRSCLQQEMDGSFTGGLLSDESARNRKDGADRDILSGNKTSYVNEGYKGERGRERYGEIAYDAYDPYDENGQERSKYDPNRCDPDGYEVTHKERRKRGGKKKTEKKIDKLFGIIHPAVLLSGLFLFALLEIIYYFGGLGLTEAGGIFFLIVSVEMLVNKQLQKRGEEIKKAQWAEEEEDEMYRILREEMYEVPRQEEKIAETQYLGTISKEGGLRLISVPGGEGGNGSGSGSIFPDIYLNQSGICIGKIKGESDIILDSPTVSRVHARLERKDGKYYLKDLNSRNGTYCNGRKLAPQEQCEITEGDRISFAEAAYQVVKL